MTLMTWLMSGPSHNVETEIEATQLSELLASLCAFLPTCIAIQQVADGE